MSDEPRPQVDDAQPNDAQIADTRDDSVPMPDPQTGRASTGWRPIVVYCLIAFGLAWLVCLPLWLGDGLASPTARCWSLWGSNPGWVQAGRSAS